MSNGDSKRIAEELLEQLTEARLEFLKYQEELDELVKDAPSGLPFSDG